MLTKLNKYSTHILFPNPSCLPEKHQEIKKRSIIKMIRALSVDSGHYITLLVSSLKNIFEPSINTER